MDFGFDSDGDAPTRKLPRAKRSRTVPRVQDMLGGGDVTPSPSKHGAVPSGPTKQCELPICSAPKKQGSSFVVIILVRLVSVAYLVCAVVGVVLVLSL